MAVQVQGDTGTVNRVEEGRRAARVVLDPNSGNEVLGHYLVGEPTGIIPTIAAGAEIFQFRNSHASNLAVIERVVVTVVNAAAVTAAQEFGWDLIRASAWSAQGTLGTALVPNKRRSTMAGSTMTAGDIRVAAAVALGGGTKTLDAVRTGSGPGPLTNAIGASGPVTYLPEDDVRYPMMILGNNEGFVIRNLVAYVTGSARFHVRVLWREVSSY